MKFYNLFLSLIILFGAAELSAQKLEIKDDFLKIEAGASDPLYTTYTAAIERARLYGDKGYKMIYYEDNLPVRYSGDQAGIFYTIWKVNEVVVNRIGDFYRKPVVKASFADMAVVEYEPFKGIEVQETFFVHSSDVAVVNLQLKNTSPVERIVDIYPVLQHPDSLYIVDYDKDNNAYITNHYESKYRLISSLYKNGGYPTDCRNVFAASFEPYSFGAYDGTSDDFYITMKTDFYSDNRNDSLNKAEEGDVSFISLHGKVKLAPGEEANMRYFRGWQDQKEELEPLIDKINSLKTEDLQSYVDDNVELFASVPRLDFHSEEEKLVYLGALNLVRGCMLPPAGETSHNFYVFSREPLWGWGHGHQVLHESLSMLAYAYLDPESAQGSQRVYMEQQGDDGLIAYRHGPRGLQDYPHYSKVTEREMSTTSAPFYSWINLELYKVSKDDEFLKDAYESGVKYVDWLFENRDLDKDGTFEWGPYGIIENVRDWYNAVFQVSAERYLDVDKEDISDELECLDLTVMVINEMRCLSEMAGYLGKTEEAEMWHDKADETSDLVNELMWDDSSQFYYSVNKKDHSFQFMTRDLRRMEIIGFLPLWSKTAPEERADILVEKLKDPDKFWRTYGVPTLAADDPWFSPYVDYCCKWNGPVWLLWDYMVYDGLMKYGYKETADQLAAKMMLAVTAQLSANHNFWESFSPDNTSLNCPRNYIWDAIMAKLIIDVHTREAGE